MDDYAGQGFEELEEFLSEVQGYRVKPFKPYDLILYYNIPKASSNFCFFFYLQISTQICTSFSFLSVRKAAAASAPNLSVGLLPFPRSDINNSIDPAGLDRVGARAFSARSRFSPTYANV